MPQTKIDSEPRFKPLHVHAVVRDVKTDKEVATHAFDFNNLEKRDWYNKKLLVWALLNGHSVELINAEDDME